MMYVARLCKRNITCILSSLIILLLCLTYIKKLYARNSKPNALFLKRGTSHVEAETDVTDLRYYENEYDHGNGNDRDPTDMVYIWMNASDQTCIHDLEAFSRKRHKIPAEILAQNRYNDWGTLKYSLRSVEKFAPWIRTIHIVTGGQIPDWLALHNRRINIITHKEIFPNRSDLPTFSSAAIECHLHRIFELSKRFIYMRDDIILKRKLDLSYFYTDNEGYKLRFIEDGMELCNQFCRVASVNNGICDQNCTTASCEFDGEDCKQVKELPVYNGTDKSLSYNSWDASLRHTSFVFNKVFKSKDRFMPAPGPYMLDKDIVAEMVNRFTDEMRATSSTKLQDRLTFQPLFAYYSYVREMEQIGKLDTKITTMWSVHEVGLNDFSIRSADFIMNLLTKIIKGRGTFIVLSNYFPEILNDADRNTRENIFNIIFQDMFPTPSQFEVK